jgi:hypothetical protein
MSDMLQKMKDFLETDEGKESIRQWGLKMEREDAHQKRWIEKFKQRCEGDLDGCIEKLMDKYYSDEYRDREYDMSIEPRESLLWLALEYAHEYCKPCDDEKYLNDFTGGAYYIGSYVIQVMYGQGSVLRIDKVEDVTDKDLMS